MNYNSIELLNKPIFVVIVSALKTIAVILFIGYLISRLQILFIPLFAIIIPIILLIFFAQTAGRLWNKKNSQTKNMFWWNILGVIVGFIIMFIFGNL